MVFCLYRLLDTASLGRAQSKFAMQVGASNELPESEELDALFDRFLVRRQVSQVSSSQLPALARLAAGRLSQAVSSSSSEAADSNGGSSSQQEQSAALDLEDFK